jgi:hypothetical protein
MSSATPTTASSTTTDQAPHVRTGGDGDRTPPAATAPRRLGRTLVAFAAGAAATALVAGGVAVAAIPASTTGTTTLCVATKGGAARVIDTQAGQKCTARERRIALAPGVTHRGAWSSKAGYTPGAVVTHLGGSYLAKAPSKGKAPAANPQLWGVLASPAPVGAQGTAVEVASFPNDGTAVPAVVEYTELDRVTLPAGRYVLQQTLQASASGGAIDIVCHLVTIPAGSSTQTPTGLGYSRLRTPDDTAIDTIVVGTVDAAGPFDAVVSCVRNSGKNVGTPRVRGTLVLTPVGAVSQLSDDDGEGGSS